MAAKDTALTIKRNFTRTAQKFVKQFSNLSIGNFCDAQGRVGALDYRKLGGFMLSPGKSHLA